MRKIFPLSFPKVVYLFFCFLANAAIFRPFPFYEPKIAALFLLLHFSPLSVTSFHFIEESSYKFKIAKLHRLNENGGVELLNFTGMCCLN